MNQPGKHCPWGTHISNCGKYRYFLSRKVSETSFKAVSFIMLNPSTADEVADDPTVRRCIGFAKTLGFGYLHIVNLFALRATDPAALKKASDPIGPENMNVILKLAAYTDTWIAAWGTLGGFGMQDKKVMQALAPFDLYALGTTKDGHPKHPLYLPKDLQPKLFRARLM